MSSRIWYFFKIVVCGLVFEKNWFWSLNKYHAVMEKVVDNEELVKCMPGDPGISKLFEKRKMNWKK